MAQLSKSNRATRRLAEQIASLQFEASTRIEQHSGPLPAPETLAAYEKLLPGLADRIVRNAEEEGKHRRSLESQLLTAQIKDAETFRVIE